MGNVITRSSHPSIRLKLKTVNRQNAGTDDNIFIILRDSSGQETKPQLIVQPLRNLFQRGSLDSCLIKTSCRLLDVNEIEIWREGVFDDGWFAEYVTASVTGDIHGAEHIFPVHRWIPNKPHLILREYDCCLPQFDCHKRQRSRELEESRDTYRLCNPVKGIPSKNVDIPRDEMFSQKYSADFLKLQWRVMLMTTRQKLLAGRWKDLDDITNIYRDDGLPLPVAVKSKIHLDDSHFGNQRLMGCNPTSIRLCTLIPARLAVTKALLAPYLEGGSLNEALEANRIFIVDYNILDNLEITDEKRKFPAPIALFYLNKANNLLPIAIQLHQRAAPDNPVFLPSDPEHTWQLAKMWYNIADSSVHQSKLHLGFTHLLMESVCVVSHRQLSRSHPIFRLLAPHFRFLVAINALGLGKLLEPQGWVDSMMLCGRKGALEIIRRTFSVWRFDVDGTLPEELRSRGVENPEILPNYPYRDDSLLVYDAILSYVRDVVRGHYDDNTKVKEDHEIQAWATELATAQDEGGAGIQGIPGRGRPETVDDVIATVAPIIFTCSVQHAAVNFNQYDEYAFPMNYPAFLQGGPPKDKEPRTEGDILEVLPDKKKTLDTVMVCRILSERDLIHKRLGDFEVQYGYDPVAVKALVQFRHRLAEIERTIDARNRKRQPYTILLPSSLPNSISI